MKKTLTFTLFLLSASALASFNELECDGRSENKNVYLEIEQSFPSSNVFKRMLLSVSGESGQENHHYTVSSNRFSSFRRVQYQGSGIRLEVDLWPDTQPQWGRNYRAVLNSPDLNHGKAAVLDCQFPNAN
ncbi:MAG: hypothetical protein H0V66_10880 [Bdellovibrionales bacterium]|nr:hypothetical protein [Bdellovibrionales bacterium]